MDRYARYTYLKFDRPAERVLRITLDTPGRMNALDATGHAELAEVWRDIDTDPGVSAVILRGAGDNFSAGGDFRLVEQAIADFDARARTWKESKDLVYNLVNCSRPVVSAIQGNAVGAGLVAALLSDISIAAHDARIVDGHTRLGIAAGDHSVMLWPLLCSMAKAKYHLLLCEPVDGRKASELGLVSLSVEKEVLQDKALEIAVKLANGAPSAIRWTKYALNNWFRSAGPAFDASLALEMLGLTGPDAREGLDSHLEKRRPKFAPDSAV